MPEENGYTTIAGFLMAQSGRVLKPGDVVEHDGAIFRVERVDGRRIRRVRFTPAPKGHETKEHGAEGLKTLPAMLPVAYLQQEDTGLSTLEWLHLTMGDHLPMIATILC
jgi:hypothetical protein